MDIERLKQMLTERILVMDGAMGTQIQARNLTAKDFGGTQYEGCNEYLNLTRPDVITSIHEAYLAAGADIIETNTFGGASIVLGDYGLGGKAHEINRAGVRLARQAADRHSTQDRIRLVAGDIGPLRRGGGRSDDEAYATQAETLGKAGLDLLILESFTRLDDLRQAVRGIQQVSGKLPYLVLVSLNRDGKLADGTSAIAAVEVAVMAGAVGVGINCSWGTQGLLPILKEMGRIAPDLLLAAKPSDGVPDRSGQWIVPPIGSKAFGLWGQEAVACGVQLIGGCCGTGPDHIQELAAALDRRGNVSMGGR